MTGRAVIRNHAEPVDVKFMKKKHYQLGICAFGRDAGGIHVCRR
jgi:hypothetical protein